MFFKVTCGARACRRYFALRVCDAEFVSGVALRRRRGAACGGPPRPWSGPIGTGSSTRRGRAQRVCYALRAQAVDPAQRQPRSHFFPDLHLAGQKKPALHRPGLPVQGGGQSRGADRLRQIRLLHHARPAGPRRKRKTRMRNCHEAGPDHDGDRNLRARHPDDGTIIPWRGSPPRWTARPACK